VSGRESLSGSSGERIVGEGVKGMVDEVVGGLKDVKFCDLVDMFVDSYLKGRFDDANKYLLSIINSDVFKSVKEKVIDEVFRWCVNRAYGMGGHKNVNDLKRKLHTIKSAYPLTSLARWLAREYGDGKGFSLNEHIVLAGMSQAVVSEYVKRYRASPHATPLSDEDLNLIIRSKSRVYGFKDNEFTKTVKNFIIFVNALTHHIVKEDPSIYNEIVEEAEKKASQYLGVK